MLGSNLAFVAYHCEQAGKTELAKAIQAGFFDQIGRRVKRAVGKITVRERTTYIERHVWGKDRAVVSNFLLFRSCL